jgi:hypothetical protein
MQPAQEEANQQLQPLQQLCRFLLARPILPLGAHTGVGDNASVAFQAS